MLDENVTIEYIRKAKNGDVDAKQVLIDENVSLLKCIIKRYLGKGVEYDDLFQLACMGFLKAISGFDERFGVKFSTYAVPMAAGEIKRFTTGFTKGFILVNGKNIGRYYNTAGPQKTLYLPACWLKEGKNEFVIFETDGVNELLVEFLAAPELG